MREDVKELWVAALRDPERKQVKGSLESATTGAQCCLGVLCDVLIKNELMPGLQRFTVPAADGVVFEHNVLYGTNRMTSNGAVLPDDVVEFTGLNSSTGALPEGKTYQYADSWYETDENGDEHLKHAQVDGTSLAELNDNGYTFSQIADIIEKDF
jgi:hypothetical protein